MVLSGEELRFVVDIGWFRWINALAVATPWLHAPAYDYATYGPVLFAALLAAGWWVARRRGQMSVMAAAVWAPVATVVAVGLNQPIVAAVDEPRPYTTLPHILVLAQRSSDPAFPSDHAVMAGAVAAGVLLVTRRVLAWLAVLAALAIAFARVYIGAHYPHDVAAGLVLGAVITLVGWWALRGVLTRLVAGLADTRLCPVLSAAPASDQTRSTDPTSVAAGSASGMG